MITQAGLRRYRPSLVVSAGTCGGIQSTSGGEPIRQGDIFVASSCKFINREIIIPAFQSYITGRYPIVEAKTVRDKIQKAGEGEVRNTVRDRICGRRGGKFFRNIKINVDKMDRICVVVVVLVLDKSIGSIHQ